MLLGAFTAGTAAAEIYDFSYIGEIEDYLGIQKAETYDVAIRLPGESFEGFRLKEITANVRPSNSTAYSGPCIWLSSDLKLVKNTFTPDIASYDAEISKDGVMTIALPEDYVIPADGIYVGYTLTVNKLNQATQYPMGFAECSSPNSFFCRTSQTMPQWSDLAQESGWGAAISVVMEADALPAHAVMPTSVPSPIYMAVGNTWSGTFGFTSNASEPVNSIEVEYAIAGTTYTQNIDLPEEVPAGLNQLFSAPVTIPAIDHKLKEDVTFKVTKVNGQPNEARKADATATIGVLSSVPKHQTLIEEYTGTWCGWCTRGYAALEYIKKNEPDFVVAAFHNNDAMQVTTNYPVYPNGFPFASLDRYYNADPYYGTQRYGGKIPIVEEVKALNAEATPWGIEVSHNWVDENTLEATANVWNVMGYENENYKIAYLLVSDGLSGIGSAWNQSNNYASQSPSDNYVPELNQFCRGGEYGKGTVSQLVFDDVVISTNGIYGVDGSIPSSLEAEETASHTLTFDLSKIKKSLIPDRNKLRVIAAVLDRNGIVVNCAKNEVNDFDPGMSAVENIEEAANAPVEYYNLSGVKVAEPTSGIYIRRQGSKTEKVVIR